MEYWMGIGKALIPRKKKDMIALLLLVPTLTYGLNQVFNPDIPKATVHSETTYPKEVIGGGYFFLSFDLTWSKSCDVTAYRYITPSDGIQYLASTDQRSVVADQEDQYVIRVPVSNTYPTGSATFRSDFEFSCDWFSKYIRPMTLTGRSRHFTILKAVGMKIPEKGATPKESTK